MGGVLWAGSRKNYTSLPPTFHGPNSGIKPYLTTILLRGNLENTVYTRVQRARTGFGEFLSISSRRAHGTHSITAECVWSEVSEPSPTAGISASTLSPSSLLHALPGPALLPIYLYVYIPLMCLNN